jgi:2-polyprenyl-3-methyl-5-hydroxy-6-metoxy-1,4-benzoquinol methylase
MNQFEISVLRFNDFANEYAERFMNIESYIPAVDKFCACFSEIDPEILELACGPGNFTRYLKSQFPKSNILAIDLAPKMIEIARRLVKDVDFKVLDVRNLSRIEKEFDAIMCSFCLPFLSYEDTFKLIYDCSLKLKTGGVIYISTMEGDESLAGFEPTTFSGKSEIYFNYHKQKDLENALFQNGFTIKELIKQDYHEPGGGLLTDMIFVALKK